MDSSLNAAEHRPAHMAPLSGTLEPDSHWPTSAAPAKPLDVQTTSAAFYTTSAVAGFCMMGLEILAGPLLEPAFGKGNDVWAGIISVFILSLSVGYLLGGRLADRVPTRMALGIVLTAAGLIYCLLPLYAWDMIDVLVANIPRMRVGALIASMGLFFLPSLLLGMVSPMLVKLVFKCLEELGRTTGVIYAVAAVGNVLGVLVTNFVFVDLVGVANTLVAMGVALVIVGVGHLANGMMQPAE
ncbi:MAG: fused MFS/spermidine synthase [Proteobacteria bacterium]|jgi:MFS family permease|nr:fused MFS/spermidine synthase [Pseudomonadota bacterium]